MAKVNGRQVGGRPRLSWMDGAKVALGGDCATMCERSEIVESPGTYVIE